MVNRVLVKKMLRDVWGRKLSLLALIAIAAVGVGSFIAYVSVYYDLDGSRARYYRDYRLADFSVDLKRAPHWTVEEARRLPNIREARGRVNISVLIDLPERIEPITGTAISMPEHPRPVLNDIRLQTGSWFSGTDDEEVILNEAFARENRLRPGSRIKVLLLDKQHELLVVGTAMSPEFVYLMPPGGAIAPDPARFGVLYLQEDFLQKSADLEGAWNQIVGLAHDNSKTPLENSLDLIENRLDSYGVTSTTPYYEQPSVRFLADELAGIKVAATIMPTIFLGVAALVLNILLGRMVVQQRPVIGTLKALGYMPGAITRHYLGFGLFIGLVGGATGIGLGWLIQHSMLAIYSQFYTLPSMNAHFYPLVLLGGVGVSVFFSVLGTIHGVRYASRLEPAEAMRPPPPEKGGKVLPEYLPFFWRPLPFRWKMIFRAVFRNPFRSTVTLMASLISAALIVATLSMVDSLYELMEFEFEKVSHQDVTVSLRDPVDDRAVSEMENFPTVSHSEPQLGVVCDLSHGPRQKRIAVTALPEGHSLYTPMDAQGNPIAIPEEGLVLTRKLAQILGVKPGDLVRLRPLIARREEKVAAVMGIADTYVGLSAYADIRYLSDLLGEERTANALLSETFTKTAEPPFLKEIQARPTVVGYSERRRSLQQMTDAFTENLGETISIMVLFAGLIAFGSVLNAALVSLSERQREVGSLRVLGYTPGQISRIFSGESYLVNLTGTVLGLFAGIGLAHLLSKAYNTELYRFPAVIEPLRLAQAALIMLAFITLAQLIIFWMIRRLPWLDVLKTRE